MIDVVRPTMLGKFRGCDRWGDGAFGAPRGSSVHSGPDYAADPCEDVLSPISGNVVRIGVCYPGKRIDSNGETANPLEPVYELVEISHSDELPDGSMYKVSMKILYVSPVVNIGDVVVAGQVIGRAQDLGSRYPGITNHIHTTMTISGGVMNETIVNPELFVGRK